MATPEDLESIPGGDRIKQVLQQLLDDAEETGDQAAKEDARRIVEKAIQDLTKEETK